MDLVGGWYFCFELPHDAGRLRMGFELFNYHSHYKQWKKFHWDPIWWQLQVLWVRFDYVKMSHPENVMVLNSGLSAGFENNIVVCSSFCKSRGLRCGVVLHKFSLVFYFSLAYKVFTLEIWKPSIYKLLPSAQVLIIWTDLNV